MAAVGYQQFGSDTKENSPVDKLMPLSQEFHAGRAAVSFAFSIQNLAAACFAPLIGRLIDRSGARNVVLPGAALFGLILLSSSVLGSKIGYLYLFFIALGVIQGCTSPLSCSVIVSHWFNQRRGLALGVMMLGMGLSAIAIPPIAQRIITLSGWRMAHHTPQDGQPHHFILRPHTARLIEDDGRQHD